MKTLVAETVTDGAGADLQIEQMLWVTLLWQTKKEPLIFENHSCIEVLAAAALIVLIVDCGWMRWLSYNTLNSDTKAVAATSAIKNGFGEGVIIAKV